MDYVYTILISFVVGFGAGAYVTHRYYAPLAATAKAFAFSATGKVALTAKEAKTILSGMLRAMAQKLN